jgi:hypothetical protein
MSLGEALAEARIVGQQISCSGSEWRRRGVGGIVGVFGHRDAGRSSEGYIGAYSDSARQDNYMDPGSIICYQELYHVILQST